MQQPRARRHTRRVQVDFWPRSVTPKSPADPRNVGQKFNGFTTNISATGMFIACNRAFPVGTRLRVEVNDRGRSFVVETEVTRVRQVPTAMRQVQQSGFGVRFVPVEELLREIVPTAGSSRSAGDPAVPPDEDSIAVRFRDQQQFLEVYDRDLSQGGLFVLSRSPAANDSVVTIELQPPGELDPIRFRARVVYRVEPSSDGDSVNLMAGNGVEVLDLEALRAELKPLVDRLRGD